MLGFSDVQYPCSLVPASVSSCALSGSDPSGVTQQRAFPRDRDEERKYPTEIVPRDEGDMLIGSEKREFGISD